MEFHRYNPSILFLIKLILVLRIKDQPCLLSMKILLLLISNLFFLLNTYGQQDSLTVEERRMLDSMFQNDEFINLLMKNRVKSYADVNMGVGNRLFSLNNNAINAGQAQTNKLYYSPSLGYYHKSGVAVSATGFLAADNGNLKMYQYALSPSYSLVKEKFSVGISYTRILEGSETSFTASPFENDFYASARYKKSWLQPSLAFGYAFGKQTEYFDTAFWLLNRVVHIRDTITTRLSSISLVASASHTWEFNDVIANNDAVQLQQAVMLNAGSQRWDISHSSTFLDRRPVVQDYLKRRYGDGTASSAFNLQSLGVSTSVTYHVGRFYLQPQVYFDYYLPETSEKRLTSLFSVQAGFLIY